MDKQWLIIYTPSAINDLREIRDYVKRDNPAAVLDLLDEIDEKIACLATFPLMGKQLDELMLRRYRVLAIRNFLVVCLIDGDFVQIHRVVHGTRKYKYLLQPERVQEKEPSY